MNWKVKKPAIDGRIHTFGVRLVDTKMLVTDDKSLADKFKAFGYIVDTTVQKPGVYPESAFDQKIRRKKVDKLS